MRESGSIQTKAYSLIRWKNTECTTSGFLRWSGGIITLPVAVAADLSDNVFVQLRMVVAIVHLGGHDIKSNQIISFAYVALCGSAASKILRDA